MSVIVGIPVYDGVDLLDVTAPAEVFSWVQRSETLPNAPTIEVRLIAQQPGEITTRNGFTFIAPISFADNTSLDVLWVPGGDPPALKKLMTGSDQAYLNFLKDRSRTARYVCSVCEGALLLAQAGLLDGYQVTTHWAFIPCLKRFPEITVATGLPRYVLDRNRLTGGGISSGLDESLKLVELLAGTAVAQDVQQSIQYFPLPPVHAALPTPGKCPFDW